MESVREYVIIENGFARRIRETTLRQVNEDNLVRALTSKNNRIETGILPSGTVSMTKIGSVTSILMWRPERSVTFPITSVLARKIYGEESVREDITLFLPSQLFGVQIQGAAVVSVHLWFMTDLPSNNASVLCAPLPNQNGYGQMCLGTLGKNLPTMISVSEICRTIPGHFYASQFNDDMTLENQPYGGTSWKFLAKWEAMSKEEVAEIQWVRHASLADLVARFR